MTTPTNGTPSPELLAFQRQVREEALRVASSIDGADRYVHEFLQRVGVADLPGEGTEVTVVVTGPGVTAGQVRTLAASLSLPVGWSVRVQD